MTINNSRDQLKRDEGTVLHAYRDTNGFDTIGTGHLIDPRKGGSIPESISDALLDFDIAEKTAGLNAHLPWAGKLDPVRFAVLLNMAFNLGVEGLLEFHQTLALVQAGDYSGAAKEMLRSPWAGQVGDRANRLAKQMETGVWH